MIEPTESVSSATFITGNGSRSRAVVLSPETIQRAARDGYTIRISSKDFTVYKVDPEMLDIDCPIPVHVWHRCDGGRDISLYPDTDGI